MAEDELKDLPFETLKEMYLLTLLAFRRCAQDFKHCSHDVCGKVHRDPHTSAARWEATANKWIAIACVEGNYNYRGELHREIEELRHIIDTMKAKG